MEVQASQQGAIVSDISDARVLEAVEDGLGPSGSGAAFLSRCTTYQPVSPRPRGR